MSSDDRRSPQDRPFAFGGVGSYPKFSCNACHQWRATEGRRMLAFPGVLKKQWVCKACVKAKSEAREQVALDAGLCHHEEGASR